MIPSKRQARIAGLWCLTVAISALFAQFFVRQRIYVPGDATATAHNIVANSTLFRLGFVADLVGGDAGPARGDGPAAPSIAEDPSITRVPLGSPRSRR